jgi:transcriptional regulator with XRE-family HTH domain
MIIGDRLRAVREEKKLSQGDIEKRTGLLRCYISRVENGHTVPAIETLEKMARALEIPLYQLFYDGEKPPPLPSQRVGHVSRGCAVRHAVTEGLRPFIELLTRVLSARWSWLGP